MIYWNIVAIVSACCCAFTYLEWLTRYFTTKLIQKKKIIPEAFIVCEVDTSKEIPVIII